MLLKGKTPLITGGSRGIGAAIVTRFLREGAQVAYVARSKGELYTTYTEEARKSGGKVVFKAGDVADQTSIKAIIAEITSEIGEIDILVNNAGITRDGLAMRMSPEDWNRVLSVNLS